MHRYHHNPIITRHDIPATFPELIDVTSVFNPGAVRFRDQYLLVLRVQNRGRETYLMKATSPDGVHFTVAPQPIRWQGIDRVTQRIYHCYDARITALDNRYYILFAMDMEDACRLGLAVTDDFESYQFLGVVSDDDNRNGVLFPEKINGRYMRLDRPNRTPLSGGPTSGSTICLSESDDLLTWRTLQVVISGRFHYWDELIGAGPTPIKTKHGWLQLYHGVATHFGSANIYQMGVLLLDWQNPGQVLARGRYNILEPREPYELVGQVPNVVFASGAIVENRDSDGVAADDSQVRVYYGAADTCVALATTTIRELLNAAKQV
jgi:beta-1,4-mannooligosaccharide/beta-1,4-mannosyl-N-acetylglucosamine phosphorylase